MSLATQWKQKAKAVSQRRRQWEHTRHSQCLSREGSGSTRQRPDLQSAPLGLSMLLGRGQLLYQARRVLKKRPTNPPMKSAGIDLAKTGRKTFPGKPLRSRGGAVLAAKAMKRQGEGAVLAMEVVEAHGKEGSTVLLRSSCALAVCSATRAVAASSTAAAWTRRARA